MGRLLVLLALAACSDLRDFRGDWRGPRVGEAAVLHVGVPDQASAELAIDAIDGHGMQGQLTVAGVIDHQPFASLAGAEADVLSGMSFSGSPLRVYLAFVPTLDGKGDALAMIALYDGRRIEVRVLRGGQAPVYGIFALTEGP